MPLVLRPVPHSEELPVNMIAESMTLGDDDKMVLDNTEKEVDDAGQDTKYVQPDSAHRI